MSFTKIELDLIKQQQLEFQDLVEDCNQNELGQCAKLLAMYVAVYKQQYGDIPVESLLQISEAVSVDQDMSKIIQDGIEEASTMLRMVRDEHRQEQASFYYALASNTIN